MRSLNVLYSTKKPSLYIYYLEKIEGMEKEEPALCAGRPL
jgi:hypothetical protein